MGLAVTRPALLEPVPALADHASLAAPSKTRLPGALLGSPPGCAQSSLARGGGRTIGALASASSPVTTFVGLHHGDALAGQRHGLLGERVQVG